MADRDQHQTRSKPKAEQAVEAVAATGRCRRREGRRKTAAKPVRQGPRQGRQAPRPQGAGQGRRRAVKNTKRAAKTAKRVRQGRRAAAADQIERNTTMTYDFTKMFAGFELPAADHFQALFADAGERSQELVASRSRPPRSWPSSPRRMSKRWPKPAASPPPARAALGQDCSGQRP